MEGTFAELEFPQLEVPKALDSCVFVYYLFWTPSRPLMLITVFSMAESQP